MRPFDNFRELFLQLPQANENILQLAETRKEDLAKLSSGSWGRLGDIAVWYASWRGRERPLITKPLVAIFTGKHGVIEDKLGGKDNKATEAAVERCIKGGAAINHICVNHEISLKVFDLALECPVKDITTEEAMDEKSCAATMAFGMETTADGIDLLCLSSIGWRNNFIASAICYALYGGKAEDWLIPELDETSSDIEKKVNLLEQIVSFHRPSFKDSFDVLRALGGREFSAITGAILAARMNKIPVIIDNFTAAAAAAILHAYDDTAIDHCLIASLSGTKAADNLREKLAKQPLLTLDIVAEEAISGALAVSMVKDAVLLFHSSCYDNN